MSKWSKICLFVSGLAIILLFVLRFILGGWIDYLYIPLGIAVAAFVAALVFDFRLYIEFFTMRTTKHGMNMGALIVIALLLAVAVNYLSFRFNHSWDVTEEKLNSLSEQSEQVIKGLKDDVTFTVLYAGADNEQERVNAKENLSVFTNASKRVKLRFLNFYEDVQAGKQYFKEGEKPRFMIVAEQGSRKTVLDDNFSEANITAALIKVSRNEQRTIYFISGHGEADIDEEGPGGLRDIRQGLEEMSFKVAKVALATGDKLPVGNNVVAIVGPQTPYLESEIEQIRTFAKNGGHVLIAIDPGMRHGLANLTKSLGVEFKNNYVVTEQIQQVGIATVGAQYDRVSDITRRFAIGFFTLFFEASEVVRAPGTPTDWTVRDLVQSEAQAYIVNDPKKGLRPSEGRARTLAIEVEIPYEAANQAAKAANAAVAQKAKIVVFGDSDFLTGKAIHQMGNRDLALNIFADLGREPELVGIRPKQPKGSTLIMTKNSQIAILIAGIGLPVALLILGGFFWFRRRHL